jgi:hypothetical protein
MAGMEARIAHTASRIRMRRTPQRLRRVTARILVSIVPIDTRPTPPQILTVRMVAVLLQIVSTTHTALMGVGTVRKARIIHIALKPQRCPIDGERSREPEWSRMNWHTVSQPKVACATDPLPAADRSRKRRFERMLGWYHSVLFSGCKISSVCRSDYGGI